MGKGKGRGSAKNTLHWEIQQEVRKVHSGSSSRARIPTKAEDKERQRPRLNLGLGQLRNLLRERRSHEDYEWMQQRRRAGFVLNQNQGSLTQVKGQKEIPSKPLGSLLFSPSEYKSYFEGSPTASLQNKSLQVLGEYLTEYLQAMGVEELHAALSLLPAETLAALSVVVSKATGVGNQLAYVLGGHPHVEALCFRASKGSSTDQDCSLDDEGLFDLIPKRIDSPTEINASWEDIDEEDYEGLMNTLEGSTFRLKRLELVDCPLLSATGILALLENCPFITHLSFAGCLNRQEGGIQVIQCLPKLLPALQVLDITRCSWVTSLLVKNLTQFYESRQQLPPVVYFREVRANFNEYDIAW
jgi:hypothetical protein